MDSQLFELLSFCSKQNIAKSNETHVSFYGPSNGWSIPQNALATFWDKYCELVETDVHFEGKFYLGEKVPIGGVAPVTALLTFKFDAGNDVSGELYDENFVPTLVATFQQVIAQTLQVPNGREFICAFMENETKTADANYVYMNMRVQFPFCPVDVSIQREHLCPRIISKLRSTNVTSFLTSQPVEGWEKIIDMSFKDGIPMYGSTKSPNDRKMNLVGIYTKIVDDNYENLELEEVFEPYDHKHVQDIPELAEKIEDRLNESGKMFYLPMFLSMFYPKGIVLPKTEVVATRNKEAATKKVYKPTDTDSQAVKFLENIHPSRFTEEKKYAWLDIGRSLFTIYEGGDDGLDLWSKYSVRAKGFTKDDCELHYYGFKRNNLTVKTLAWFAYKDDKEAYSEVMKDEISKMMERSLSMAHTDVAETLYQHIWLETAYDGRDWYQYAGHRWIKIEGDGITISKYISTKFVKQYELLRHKVNGEILQLDGDNDEESARKEKLENTHKKIGEIISKLKNMSFKHNVKKALSEFCYVEGFRGITDTNPDYTGCQNGVIEIVGKVAVFREGKPEDYITMSTGTAYNKKLTWTHPMVQNLEKWFGQVFVDKELRHHFYKDCSSFLYGRNAEKIFRIYSGDGNNSKSMIMKLQQQTLGQYVCDLPITLITAQRTQSSGATPELAQAKGTHVGFLAEPDQEDQMKGGTIKALTGGDRFFARMLHDNGGSMDATFKLVLACNRIPSIVADNAIRNRLRVIPFLSKWTEDAPETEGEQYAQKKFKIDYEFERNIPDMTQAFLWLMVQVYSIYQNEGLTVPPIVKEMTKKYWDDTDPYENFVSEKITFVYSDEEKKILSKGVFTTTKDLYTSFKFWFKNTYPNQQKIPAANIFRASIANRLNQQLASDSKWYGININYDDESAEAN